MQQNITASLYYELCNVEKCILSTILTEEVAQWLNSYLTEKKQNTFLVQRSHLHHEHIVAIL